MLLSPAQQGVGGEGGQGVEPLQPDGHGWRRRHRGVRGHLVGQGSPLQQTSPESSQTSQTPSTNSVRIIRTEEEMSEEDDKDEDGEDDDEAVDVKRVMIYRHW